MGFDQLKVALSVGVMPMVRSDKASSGVIFTLDPESGFRTRSSSRARTALASSWCRAWSRRTSGRSSSRRSRAGVAPSSGARLGTKEVRLVYADGSRATRSEPTPADERRRFCLADDDVLTLAGWACRIEDHYSDACRHAAAHGHRMGEGRPDGRALHRPGAARDRPLGASRGRPSRRSIVSTGTPESAARHRSGGRREDRAPAVCASSVTCTRWRRSRPAKCWSREKTDPDWEPVMRRVAAIVTDQGGRTAHAAIVSREFGLPCIVGTTARDLAPDRRRGGDRVLRRGGEGHVYDGTLPFTVDRLDASAVPETRTRVMLIVGDPGRAFALAAIAERRRRPGADGIHRHQRHRHPSDGAGTLSEARRSRRGDGDRAASSAARRPRDVLRPAARARASDASRRPSTRSR